MAAWARSMATRSGEDRGPLVSAATMRLVVTFGGWKGRASPTAWMLGADTGRKATC